MLQVRKILCGIAAVLWAAALAAAAVPAWAAAEKLPPLAEAEKLVGDGPEVLAALAALERDSQLRDLERQREGVKYFLNAGVGCNSDPLFNNPDSYTGYITAQNADIAGKTFGDLANEKKTKISDYITFDDPDGNYRYGSYTASAGLIFPLLGTWDKQKISALQAEIRAISARYRPQILMLGNLAALRKAYITLWSECEKTKAAADFLSTEARVSQVLADRQAKGLVLPADRLEFMTAYAMARRDLAVSNLRRTQALQIIRLATGHLWQMPSEMEEPSLPSFDGLAADLDNNPELLMRKETVARYAELLKTTRRIDREGSLTVGASIGRDDPGGTASGVYASVNITEPLKTAFSKRDKARDAASSDLLRAQRDDLYMRIRIEGEADETVALASYAAANIKAQQARLASMSESVRERLIRHASIAGDTFEQLQSSRYQYYRVLMDMLDAEMIFMQTGADMLGYAYPGGAASEPAARSRPIVRDAYMERLLRPEWLTSYAAVPGGAAEIKPQQSSGLKYSLPAAKAQYRPGGVYIWNTSALLSESRETELAKLSREGFRQLLLSFTAAQLRELTEPRGRRALQELLTAVSARGMRADLLLGDPYWLLPDKRAGLVEIVKKFAGLGFGGVHLDLEPDALPGSQPRRAELLEALADTVAEVKAAAALPVSLSIHSRYLDGNLGGIFRRRFAPLGIEYAAVMLYSTDGSAAGQAARLLDENASVPLKIAQSVEKQLPQNESWFASGAAACGKGLAALNGALKDRKNYQGLMIQSWQDYMEMVNK